MPSSASWSGPVALPYPLITWQAPSTLSAYRLPPWGRIAVTPVRRRSLDDRAVTHEHAGHVHETVPLPGGKAPDREAELA